MNKTSYTYLLLLSLLCMLSTVSSFTLSMMGARRGKGRGMNIDGVSSKTPKTEKQKVAALNNGRGQEITGVTMPAENKVKGWEFGAGARIACANVDGEYYAVQGDCPRCAFDLYKGDIINDDSFEDLPRIACPTCSTTYSLKTGVKGPPLKRTGLAGFVTGLAKTATQRDEFRDVKAFVITREEETGRVFMREK